MVKEVEVPPQDFWSVAYVNSANPVGPISSSTYIGGFFFLQVSSRPSFQSPSASAFASAKATKGERELRSIRRFCSTAFFFFCRCLGACCDNNDGTVELQYVRTGKVVDLATIPTNIGITMGAHHRCSWRFGLLCFISVTWRLGTPGL